MEFLTREAFYNLFVPGCSEHFVLHQLRKSPGFLPALSLFALADEKIVGHIAYTRARVLEDEQKEHPVVTFGPLSVLPEFQKQGVGRALIEHSKQKFAEMGFPAILIYGNPVYYQRFGFSSASRYHIARPDGNFAAALMALPLFLGALEGVSGRFVESPAYEINELELAAFDREFPPKKKTVTPTQKEFERISNLLE